MSSSSGRRERERQRHRETMIEAGIHLFAAKGYFGTTVEAIAAASEFSRTAIYMHFPGGKEELYVATMVAAVQARTDFIKTALEEAEPGRPPLRTVWEAFCRLYDEHPDYVRLIGYLGFEDIRTAIPAASLQSVPENGYKTFPIIGLALRGQHKSGPAAKKGNRPDVLRAWSLWSCFLGTIQFAESLAHLGNKTTASELLDSTLALIEEDHAER